MDIRFAELLLIFFWVAGSHSKSISDLNAAEKDRICYPYEDAGSLGFEQTQASNMDWIKYYMAATSRGFLEYTRGETIDWDQYGQNNSNSICNRTPELPINNPKCDEPHRRWVVTMRHSERIDITYGDWISHSFDERGNYIRKDLNMPLTIIKRAGGKGAFSDDTPLTRLGRMQAYLVGEGLRLAGVTVDHIYSSPGLRCVETAQGFLDGLRAKPSLKIKIEPGLYEGKMWHSLPLAPFVTAREFRAAGYNVDLTYKPYAEMDLYSNETLDEYYIRGRKAMHGAVRDTEKSGGNIMFVGHATTHDMMVVAMKQYAVHGPDPLPYELTESVLTIPYAGLAAMRDNPWELVAPPTPPALYTSAGRFDWKVLEDRITMDSGRQ